MPDFIGDPVSILRGFPHDPALPQLARATDPARMREIFQQNLRGTTGQPFEIRACALTRIRRRPANRCILQYTLRGSGPDADAGWEQIITGALYAEPGRAKMLSEKYGRRAPAEALAGKPFAPCGFIPELEMFVQSFPYDRHLPALPALLSGLPEAMKASLLARFGSRDWRIESSAADMVRYRAGLGATIRYTVQFANVATGASRRQYFYAKIYPDDQGERTLARLRQLRDQLPAVTPEMSVIEPVAYFPQEQALLLDAAAGIPLEQFLAEQDDVAVVRRMARNLAAFNQSALVLDAHHTRADEIAGLNRAGARLQWACPELSGEIGHLIETISAGYATPPPAPTHRDLKADHVFIEGERLMLIDLDSCAMADPMLDPAMLLARFATLPHQSAVPARRARAAAQTFADAYFACAPTLWRRLLPGYYAGAVLDCSQGFFSRQEPHWRATISAMVREASESLAGRIW